jgi:hypothetical protein
VLLFWIAFVLTCPFSVTFGDLLTKGKAQGGLDFGTINATLVSFALFIISFGIEMYNCQYLAWATTTKEVESNKNLPEVKAGRANCQSNASYQGDK